MIEFQATTRLTFTINNDDCFVQMFRKHRPNSISLHLHIDCNEMSSIVENYIQNLKSTLKSAQVVTTILLKSYNLLLFFLLTASKDSMNRNAVRGQCTATQRIVRTQASKEFNESMQLLMVLLNESSTYRLGSRQSRDRFSNVSARYRDCL